jgi:DNA anti-recombination protein RmuC
LGEEGEGRGVGVERWGYGGQRQRLLARAGRWRSGTRTGRPAVRVSVRGAGAAEVAVRLQPCRGRRAVRRGLRVRCAALQKDLEQLAAEAAKRGDIERSLADALLVAQREAHAIREEARREAEQTVESARRKAGKIAEGAEETARRQARAIVDSAARERDLILEDVERARAFADETHDDLSVLLQSALKWFERGTKGRKQAELQPPTG